MILVKDILKLYKAENKNKQIRVSNHTKEYTLNHIDSITIPARIHYSNSEGLELKCLDEVNNGDIFDDLINIICKHNIPDYEMLIMWGNDCIMYDVDYVTITEDFIVFC